MALRDGEQGMHAIRDAMVVTKGKRTLLEQQYRRDSIDGKGCCTRFPRPVPNRIEAMSLDLAVH